jgi:hypothetical protein
VQVWVRTYKYKHDSRGDSSRVLFLPATPATLELEIAVSNRKDWREDKNERVVVVVAFYA